MSLHEQPPASNHEQRLTPLAWLNERTTLLSDQEAAAAAFNAQANPERGKYFLEYPDFIERVSVERAKKGLTAVEDAVVIRDGAIIYDTTRGEYRVAETTMFMYLVPTTLTPDYVSAVPATSPDLYDYQLRIATSCLPDPKEIAPAEVV